MSMDRLGRNAIYLWLFLYAPCVSLAAINVATDSYKDHVAHLESDTSGGVLLDANKSIVEPSVCVQLPVKVKLHPSESKTHSKRNFFKQCFIEPQVTGPVTKRPALPPTHLQLSIEELNTYAFSESKPPLRKSGSFKQKVRAAVARQLPGYRLLKEEKPESKDHEGGFSFPTLASSNMPDAETLLANFKRSNSYRRQGISRPLTSYG